MKPSKQDYEDAARRNGWRTLPDHGNGILWTRDEEECDIVNNDGPPVVETAEEACEFDHIEV